MAILVVGLVIFLGVHSVRIVAEDWRRQQLSRLGEKRWKGLYSLASVVGLALVVWGYGLARAEPLVLWNPPRWTHTLTALLTVPAFVLIAAAYVPGNRAKAAMGHPMLAGVKLWALAHLLSNGRLEDMLLFGAFLVWAIFAFRAARQRDRVAGTAYADGTIAGDVSATVIGLAIWGAFAVYLHVWLIGVPTIG